MLDELRAAVADARGHTPDAARPAHVRRLAMALVLVLVEPPRLTAAHERVHVEETLSVPAVCVPPCTVPEKVPWRLPVMVLPLTV